MNGPNSRNILAAVLLITSFALLLLSLSMYYNYHRELRAEGRISPENLDNMTISEIKILIEQRRSDELFIKSYYLLPFAGFVGLLVGTAVYYIMAGKLVQQTGKLERNARIILKFLNQHERKVVEMLLENEGKMAQYELSHLPGLNKVKTHRIINSLEQKGLITKVRLGKINRISLNRDLYEVLK